MQPKKKIIHYEVPGKPWEIVGADLFSLHNKSYLCILDYHSKFHVIKHIDDLSADSLILACKIMFFRILLIKKYCQMQVVTLLQINTKDSTKPEYRASSIIIGPSPV